MARMAIGQDLEPGQWFDEPAAGTGGMFRAAAQCLRETERNPHDYVWCMTDVDQIAAACCAVNAIVWDLGPHVLVARADTLREGDRYQQALAERKAVFAHRDEVIGQAQVLAAWRRALALLEELMPTAADQPKAS